MHVDPDGYRARVRARVKELVEILGDAGRMFEVGMRSATCLEQHLIALEACKAEGLGRTSHVYAAQQLGLVPVGTMGHEHVQRYGGDDAAFRAMAERRPHRSSFLLDTFDTMKSGIPTALKLIAERPHEGDSIRYDSGDKEAQLRFACEGAMALGVRPVHILEDSFDAELTRKFESLRDEVGVKAHEQVYGYGGYLVAATSGSPLTRDRVSAVYKLSMTGHRATMKFGNESGAGKQSVPGRPVLFRRELGAAGAIGVVGQQGEAPPKGYRLATGSDQAFTVAEAKQVAAEDQRLELSEQTRVMVEKLRKEHFA
jgi:nicotinic acid phosphoribosyltransferase